MSFQPNTFKTVIGLELEGVESQNVCICCETVFIVLGYGVQFQIH